MNLFLRIDKKFILNFLSILIILITNIDISLAKVVQIRVTEAKDIGVKLVILPFEKLEEVVDIIAKDLNYTGQFKVLDLDLEDLDVVEKIPNNSQEIDFKFWRDYGAEYLLLTKLEPSNGRGNLLVKLQLLDLYKPLEPISFDTEIKKYSNEQPRKFAHRVSNIIFEKLIGRKGFFNTKIAYVRVENLGEKKLKYSLNIADFDGFNEYKILSVKYPLMSPNWSKDGKKISFVSFKNNRSNISVADLESGKINIITSYPGINGAPAWSPDGNKLALVLSKDGNPKIYILDLLNNNLQKITNGIAIDTEPFWNNQGTEIFFTSNRGGKPQIYKISLLNNEITRVTFHGEYNATPSLTPDNKNLVMLHCMQNCSKTENGYTVAVQSLDNGNVKILSKMGMEDSPVVAPNGIMVLYGTERNKFDNNRILASISMDGHFGSYLAIPGNGSIKNPAWSPILE